MGDSRSMHCTDCGEPLDEEVSSAPENSPCPKCGSQKKTVCLSFSEDINLQLKDSLRGKVKDVTKTGKEKLRKDFLTGDDLHRKSGKWYKKDRCIDKDNDHYKEMVVDPENGEVIHHCEEPLREHRGHGSAKKNSDE